MKIDISIVVPVFNEEINITPFLNRVVNSMNEANLTYEVIFCLDPSTDDTESRIKQEAEKNAQVKALIFSRRFGQPAASLAGISYSKGSVCAVIDVDLQDPPELLIPMYKKIKEGYEVVFAKRKSRKGETFIKRKISEFGYWVISKLSDVNIPRDAGDFRIMTRKVVDEVIRMQDSSAFLRGIVAYVGFQQAFIEYDRDERFLGNSKYNRFTGSLKIGINGLVGFSSKPLFLMTISGFIFAAFGFLLGLFYILQKMFSVEITPGLPTTVAVVSFFSGIQLLCMGLMGEYIGRIYDEVKGRPLYIVDRKINCE